MSTNNIKFDQYDTIVLSGGATAGFILLGALQHHFDQKHITNDTVNYLGTSVGSILTFLICIGYTPIELMVSLTVHNFMNKLEDLNIMNMIHGNGACSWQPVHAELEKITIDKIGYLPTMLDIKEKLNKNFCCTTYNLSEDRVEYLSHVNYPHLPCLTALRMSSNLPLVFEKFKYGGNFYIDGGLVDNFPVEFAHLKLENNESILGVCIFSKNLEAVNEENFPNINFLEYLYKILMIPITAHIEKSLTQSKKYADILTIKPKTEKKAFDFNLSSAEKMNMFTHGYSSSKFWRSNKDESSTLID